MVVLKAKQIIRKNEGHEMGLQLVIGLSFLACSAVFILLTMLIELTADYWFSEDKG